VKSPARMESHSATREMEKLKAILFPSSGVTVLSNRRLLGPLQKETCKNNEDKGSVQTK
jgi:hypothetical protein